MQSYYFFYQAITGADFIMFSERPVNAKQEPENFLHA